jgi:hypothetical protein
VRDAKEAAVLVVGADFLAGVKTEGVTSMLKQANSYPVLRIRIRDLVWVIKNRTRIRGEQPEYYFRELRNQFFG